MTRAADRQTLYDQDFQAWIAETVAQLKAREIGKLDWDNLIEEMEALGKSERREIESRLRVLIAHILKRLYIASANDYRGWENTIEEQRSELDILLRQSPSLKAYFSEVFDGACGYALRTVGKNYPGVVLPEQWPFSREISAILTEDWWQEQR